MDAVRVWPDAIGDASKVRRSSGSNRAARRFIWRRCAFRISFSLGKDRRRSNAAHRRVNTLDVVQNRAPGKNAHTALAGKWLSIGGAIARKKQAERFA